MLCNQKLTALRRKDLPGPFGFLIRLMLIRVLIDELMVMIFILEDIEHNTLYNHVLHQYEYHQLKASRAFSFGLWFMRNGSSMYN